MKNIKFCIDPFPLMISKRKHAIKRKYEWGPKTAKFISCPLSEMTFGRCTNVQRIAPFST